MKFSSAMRVLISLVLVVFVSGCRKAPPAAPIFDVPSLVGKRLPDIQKTLGASQNSSWTRDNITLQAEASPRGRITRFVIKPKEPLREGDKKEFLQQLELQESDARYSLEWLENESNVQQFDGVQITPVPKTYSVTLRVTGSNVMTWVKYSPSPSDAPGGGESLTLPPWDAQISAQSGAVVSLEAGFSQAMETGKLTLQIEADGKVETEKTISAGSAKIEAELP